MDTANLTHFSPYVMGRSCRLSAERLQDLAAIDFWQAVDSTEKLEAEYLNIAVEISERLLSLVSDVDATARADLVNLRRDVHNSRSTKVLDALARGVVSGGDAVLVEQWLDAHTRVRELRGSLPILLEEWFGNWRRHASDIFSDDAVAPGVQLSGDKVYNSIVEYIANDHGSSYKPSRRRSAEASLCNFLYRAALKPTPFGRFVSVSSFPFSASASDGGGAGEYSVVRANRVLVNWLFNASPLTDASSDSALVMLNSTAEILPGGVVRFVSNSREMGARGYCGYGVVRLRLNPALQNLISRLSRGPASGRECRATVEAGLSGGEEASAYLTSLTRIGLLFCRIETPEQSPDYLLRLKNHLTMTTGVDTTRIGDCLALLLSMEEDFADSDVSQRATFLAQARKQANEIVQTLEVIEPPAESLKAPVYEDTVTYSVPGFWDPALVSSNVAALDALWTTSSILDYGQLKRLGLYEFAKPFARENMSAIDLFERFSALPTAHQDDILAARNSELGALFLEERRAFLGELRDSMGMVNEDVVKLTAEDVRRAAELVPHAVRPQSITFRVQTTRKTERNGGRKLVVNGVNTGFGAFFSRFCGAPSPRHAGGSWDLEGAVREHVTSTFPSQSDVNAVFGLNFNIHPLLAPTTVDYPGGVVGSKHARRSLQDCLVIVDDDSHSVRLVARETGAEIDLLPMNFLIPLWSPPLYKMLEGLSPTILYPWRLAADLSGAPVGTVPPSTARLMVDDVVADRRTWSIPAEEIPTLSGLARDELDAILRFDTWRREAGLPERAFVLCQTVSEYDLLGGRNPELARSLERVSHMRKAAVHKPMFIDFRNPMLLRCFARAATARPDIVVSIRECLPDLSEYGQGGASASAEEFFVELNSSD